MNSIISWVGGKKALRDLIYLRMPKHYDRYIEVFGGGGWVLDGELRETQTADYFSSLCPIDCTVPSLNA